VVAKRYLCSRKLPKCERRQDPWEMTLNQRLTPLEPRDHKPSDAAC